METWRLKLMNSSHWQSKDSSRSSCSSHRLWRKHTSSTSSRPLPWRRDNSALSSLQLARTATSWLCWWESLGLSARWFIVSSTKGQGWTTFWSSNQTSASSWLQPTSRPEVSISHLYKWSSTTTCQRTPKTTSIELEEQQEQAEEARRWLWCHSMMFS